MTTKHKKKGKESYIRSIRNKASHPKCSKANKDQIYRTIRRLNRK